MTDGSVLDAPLPVRRAASTIEAVDSDRASLGPRSAAHRVAYRLLGISRRASVIADEAVARAAGDGAADLSAVSRAVSAAVDAALSLHPQVIEAEAGDDPHAQHRARLRRELGRWPLRDRTVLALRHLVGLECTLVATIADRTEDEVRGITSHWTPEDGGTADQFLLRGIDRWIGGGVSIDEPRMVRRLGHLDVLID